MATKELNERRRLFAEWSKQVELGNEKPEKMQFRSTDILIMGPAKSGTTWLQQILHQIRTGGDEDFSDIYDVSRICPKFITALPGYQIDGEQKAKPRIFKAHSSYEAIPMVEGMKLVVVVRDPIDAVFSYVKFGTRFYGVDRDMTRAELEDIYKSPSFDILDPPSFITNWYPHRHDPNIIWLHYEDLIKDLKFCIEKLAEFLAVKLSGEQLQRVHNFCTFAYMSSHKEKFSGGEWIDAIMGLSKNPANWHSQLGMVRAEGGKVGQGQKLMSPDIQDFIATLWEDKVAKPLGFANYQELLANCSLLLQM